MTTNRERARELYERVSWANLGGHAGDVGIALIADALDAAEARGHAAGRAEERRAAVAWLRSEWSDAVNFVADDIERGTHAKEEA